MEPSNSPTSLPETTSADIQLNPARCRNCGAVLHGDYCSQCGQREGRGDITFVQALGDVFTDMVTWDSRFWRTIVPLLFRPGYLTAEFMRGRRARYMPPFRLYLVISFVTFLAVSLGSSSVLRLNLTDDDVDAREQAIETLLDDPALSEKQRARLEKARERIATLPPETSQAADDNDPRVTLTTEDGPEWLKTIETRVNDNIGSLRENPDQFIDALYDALPQVMFLMLPVFALFLRGLYLFSPIHYLQHLVFALHYHSFVYMLYLFGQVLESLGGWINAILSLALVVYLPKALMTAYGSRTRAAIFKSTVLVAIYSVALLAVFALISILTLAVM